jgi:hypothetical protein
VDFRLAATASTDLSGSPSTTAATGLILSAADKAKLDSEGPHGASRPARREAL